MTTRSTMATTNTINDIELVTRGEQDEPSGTGSGFGQVLLILTGVSALAACLLTILYVVSIHHYHQRPSNTSPRAGPPSSKPKTTANPSCNAM